MRYDCFDAGICLEAPLIHRKYKCKICREYFKPSFQVNALWCGYWRFDHIKFCYEHTEQQMLDWLISHWKVKFNESSERDTIHDVVNIYLEQQKELDMKLLTITQSINQV